MRIRGWAKKSWWLGAAVLGVAFSFWQCNRREEKPREVQIFAVNDIHAALENFPRLAYVADSLRAIYPDLLLVSGGDNQTGNPINDQAEQRGMPIIKLMDRVGFDASALGNHEFDVSAVQMRRNLEMSRCAYLCANAIHKDSTYPMRKNEVLTLPNGLRLGLSSLLYINPSGYPDSHPMNTEGFRFYDPIEVGRQEFESLRQKCDVLVFLTHLGLEWDKKLAEALPRGGADAIVGGHSHTLIRDAKCYNGMLITQAGSKLRWGTLVRIRVTDSGATCDAKLIRVSGEGAEDMGVRAYVDSLRAVSGFNETVAQTEKGVRGKEQLGYLMADGQRVYARADVALMNPGGVRISELVPGSITVQDMYSLDPFGNEIVQYDMTLQELQEFVEKAGGVDYNSILIPSGIHLRYHYQPKGNESSGAVRVELLDTLNRALASGRTYRVVMNSYMATVNVFSAKPKGKSLGVTTASATIEWLRRLGKAPDYSAEQRIVKVKE